MEVGTPCTVSDCKSRRMYSSMVCYKHNDLHESHSTADLWWSEHVESGGNEKQEKNQKTVWSIAKKVSIMLQIIAVCMALIISRGFGG